MGVGGDTFFMTFFPLTSFWTTLYYVSAVGNVLYRGEFAHLEKIHWILKCVIRYLLSIFRFDYGIVIILSMEFNSVYTYNSLFILSLHLA